MTASAALTLAQAIEAIREERTPSDSLSCALTPAQSGSALRLRQTGKLVINAQAAEAVADAEEIVNRLFNNGREGATLIGQRPCPKTFERIASNWLDRDKSGSAGETAAGYWLADAFLRGVCAEETADLTRFLAGTIRPLNEHRAPSARRYPTGGVSEKQALLLPPLMRALAREFRWCSPFLVAARLAHTGGTRDKLSVIPGFRLADASYANQWSGREIPIRYFSAGSELCPRDAEMYRIRGETGTVADMGLMCSSIMSKQIALPADIMVLDVLHGQSAFLKNAADAQSFGELCERIGTANNVNVITKSRPAPGILGHSIGASTEVVEASELLAGNAIDDLGRLELATSLGFLRIFAEGLNLDPDSVVKRAEDALLNGAAFDAMLTLWEEHGVHKAFLREVERDPRAAILGELPRAHLVAPCTGSIRWKATVIADLANRQINSVDGSRVDGSSQLSNTVLPGGIELVTQESARVSKGATIAVVYGATAGVVAKALTAAYTID